MFVITAALSCNATSVESQAVNTRCGHDCHGILKINNSEEFSQGGLSSSGTFYARVLAAILSATTSESASLGMCSACE